ncbi:MAG TPA: helix-turn-helix domain-containing protein [Candidatus Acidoferrales bacterium]|nr:helix-turn-helix domain-containing protein [Candidatus Acidoferrales bacterium]
MSDKLDKIQHRLAEKLSAFGLSDVEAKIYLHLLNKEPKTTTEIAKELELPRTSVYDNSQKLLTKGLVTSVKKYKSQKLQALSIDILQTIITKEKENIERLEENFIQLKENIQLSFNPSYNTEIKYYHGKQGLMQMMWNTLSAKDEIVRYPEYGRIEVVGKKFFLSWAHEIIEKKIIEKALINPKPESLRHFLETDQHALRMVYQYTRTLPEDTLYVSGDTTIYNNTFAVSYWKQGEIVGVEIENPELVKTQKSIFETLWKISKPVDYSNFGTN